MIESYSFGKITVDGKQYSKDLVIFPGKVKSRWRRNSGHVLSLEDMADILDYEPEVLVIGTGNMGCMKVDGAVLEKLKSLGIEYIAEKTADAVEEYNKIPRDKKAVFAAHLTC